MQSNFEFNPPSNPILEAYINELKKFSWTLFVNLSFWKETSTKVASKKLTHFLKHINSPNILVVDKYCHCLSFFEKQNTHRGGVHIHALVDRINPEYWRFFDGKARKVFGKWSQVRPYDPNRGAIHYMAKKIILDTKLDDYQWPYKISSKHYKQRNTTMIGVKQ